MKYKNSVDAQHQLVESKKIHDVDTAHDSTTKDLKETSYVQSQEDDFQHSAALQSATSNWRVKSVDTRPNEKHDQVDFRNRSQIVYNQDDGR